MAAEAAYTETSGAIARAAGVSAPTVRLYTNLGHLECKIVSNGMRLYRPEAAQIVRQILAERLANRGGHKRAA